MLECRLTPTDKPCPDYWVVVEPRNAWNATSCDVTKCDVDDLVMLRSSLAVFGVTLLDVVIFRDDFRWWSLHELACGTTEWTFEQPVPR